MEALGWTTTSVSVSAQSFVIGQNQSVPISNYFSVSNPNGDSITEYEFKDLGGGGGYFTVNGAAQPDNQVFTVSAANLSTVRYVGGASPGTDVLQVGVFDATTNSVDWSSSFTAATQTIIRTDTGSYGSTSLAQVGSNYLLFAAGTTSGPELELNGSAVTAGQFAGWAPIGAVQTATGYDVAWQDAATGQYTVWGTDSSGNYLSNIIGVVAGNSYPLESFEPVFNQDLNGDGTIGIKATTIQTDGSTSLAQVGSNYLLLALGTTSGPELQLNGSAVTTGQFAGWAPIGAVQTATGYDVAWKDAATGQYTVWATDGNGSYLSNIIGVVASNSYALESLESTFGQDLNGDGTTGLTKTVIQTDGSTSLTQVANQYFLDNAGGTGPALQVNGADVTAGQYAGWAPIGAVQTATGYDVAWKDAATAQYTVWAAASNGNYLANIIGVVAVNSYALDSLEGTFGQDLNGDGTTGLTKAVIQTDGSTSLTQVANEYFLDNAGGSGPVLQVNGANVTAGQYAGWAPIGAVQPATGYDVAWKDAATGQYTVWATDSNGNYLSNVVGVVSGTSAALEEFEPTFGQDLNGDGVVGLYAAPNTTLQISNGLSGATGAATIGAGATLGLGAADSAAVTFAASTGELVISNPSNFTGQIFGFTGNGTLSGSDQIDLKGLSDSGLSDSYSNGVLTLTSGSESVKLDFNGSYVLANFDFASDGSGGTIVYDPPASQSDTPVSSQNQGAAPVGSIALLGCYIASSFAEGGHAQSSIVAIAGAVPSGIGFLTNPHHQ